VNAFRATLEEIADAALLLHVVDAAAPDVERRIAAVREVLDSIHLGETPELLVFNRIDMLPPGVGESLAARHDGVAVSALRGTGLRELLARADEMLSEIDRREGASHEPLRLVAQGG
jgi:GTP-binding protein HflX